MQSLKFSKNILFNTRASISDLYSSLEIKKKQNILTGLVKV